MNNIAKKDGLKIMVLESWKSVSIGGRGDGEYHGVGFVVIPEIFAHFYTGTE